ncbi:MAG: hypothetical protein GY810_05365 [Aureispira sp.]|nr:hypothetical protein [Aureispira sp.]
MKNTIYTTVALFIAFLGMHTSASAQSVFTDGSIDYKIEIESPEAMAGMIAFGAGAKVSFKGNLSKMTAMLMGGAINMDMVANNKAKKGVTLLNMMGQKKAVQLSKGDFSKVEAREIDTKNIEYTKETKKIAGYTCQKAIAKDAQTGEEMILYLCKKIKPKSEGFMQNLLGSLDGFPLGMEIKSGEHKVKVMATNINQSAPSKSIFNMTIPEGYEKVSMKDIEKQFIQQGEQFRQ